ncbi:MAG: DUF4359 domain-containing protein [Rhodothermales bacterium]|nr:DUF4359 domain-containing protein [Rhodothermales bacterium]
MGSKFALAIFVIVAGLLAWANPSMTEFKEFTKTQSQTYLEDELGDNAIGRALAQAGSSIAGEYIDELVDRKNYVFFSLFEVGDSIQLDDNDNGGSDWRYLGIGGQFIRLGNK